jgi:integrase
MRKGEILRLTRDKMDLKNRRIRLVAIETKTGELRTCFICEELYRILKKIPRALHDPHYSFTTVSRSRISRRRLRLLSIRQVYRMVER